MNERVVFINVKDNADEAEKNFNNLNDEIKDTEKTTESVADNTAKIEKSSKGATKGLKGIGSAVKGLGLAFKALGIGLIISAFAVLKDIFTQNQKVADTLNTVFETMSIIFNEVTRVVVSVYESVSEATGGFDALGKVMGGLLDLVIAPFKATFFGIKLAIQAVQLAWEQSVFGDRDPKTIKNLRKEIELTRQDLVGVGQDVIKAGGQIVDNFVEAVGEVGSIVTETAKGITDISVKAAFEQAKLNVEVQNQAKIAAAQQSLLIEKYDRQAEKLRQIRDEERNTIDERIKANNDLREVLDNQEKAMLRAADMQVKAAKSC
jgi:archaellum component FlaC